MSLPNNLPAIGGSNNQRTSSIGDGSSGGIKMKSQLTKDGSTSSKTMSPQEAAAKEEEKKAMFSPTGQSKMSNFFNPKGPIKPASMLPTQAMVNGPIMPVGHGYQLHSRPGMHNMQQVAQQELMMYDDEDDEYGDEMEDYGMEEGAGMGGQ